jgi:very-short-patch-repair endonuclease
MMGGRGLWKREEAIRKRVGVSQQVAERYKSGELQESLMKEFGLSFYNFRECLKENGVMVRERSLVASISRRGYIERRHAALSKKIADAYSSGRSSKNIMKEYGVGQVEFDRSISENGIKMRRSCDWKVGKETPGYVRSKMRKRRCQYMMNHSKEMISLGLMDTDIELIVKDQLEKNGIRYVHPYNLRNLRIAEFYIPDIKLVIECDGGWWHLLPKAKKRDATKDELVVALGKKILRLPEELIRKYDFNIMNEINYVLCASGYSG